MKSDKQQLTDRIDLPNQDKIRTLVEKETCKNLRNLEANTIKQVEMKEKIKKEYLRGTRKLLKTKLSSRNLIKGINTWAVSLIIYSGPFLKCSRKEFKQIDQRTRKLVTMLKTLHLPETTLTDYMYQEKKEEQDLPALKTALTHRYNDSKTI